jgi:hypothetical protein
VVSGSMTGVLTGISDYCTFHSVLGRSGASSLHFCLVLFVFVHCTRVIEWEIDSFWLGS